MKLVCACIPIKHVIAGVHTYINAATQRVGADVIATTRVQRVSDTDTGVKQAADAHRRRSLVRVVTSSARNANTPTTTATRCKTAVAAAAGC